MRTWKRFMGFILVFAILFSFPAPVHADRISELQQELSSISSELIQINQEYASISERAGQLSEEVSRLTAMISTPGADLQFISRRLSEIQAEANSLSARKTALDERKNFLASRVSAIQQEIDALTRTVVPPPVANPPPVVTPSPEDKITAEITNTVFPGTVIIGKETEFRMEFKNTGNVAHTFTAIFTEKYPNGVPGGSYKTSVALNPGQSGSVSWFPNHQIPGEHQAKFGVWKDEETLLAESYWMSFVSKRADPPPVVAPPVVNPPPVVIPPPVNPPPQTNISGEITNTIFPTTMASGSPAAFRMDFKNTGNTSWTFIAAMTIRYPDGHDVDYQRTPLYLAASSNGGVTWNPSLQPGNYRVIFGLWKDDETALVRSYWMDFTVTASPVVTLPPVVTPPVVNPPPSVTPPPVNPPVVTPNRNPTISGSSVPAVVKYGSTVEFVMQYQNTTTDGTYIAAATIRKPDGTDEDLTRIPIVYERNSMSWGFGSFYYPPGNYQIIFGIWKGDTPVTNSGWIPFRVVTDQTDEADETGQHNPSTPISTNKPAAIIVVNNGNKTAGMYDLKGMKSVSLTGKAVFESGVWYLNARSVINAIGGFVNTFRVFPEGTVEGQISVGDQAYVVHEGQPAVMDASWRVVGSLNAAPKLISGELMLPAEFFTKHLQIAVVDASKSPSSSQEIILKMGNLLTEQPLMTGIFTSAVDDHDATITSSDIVASLSGITRIVQGDPQTLGEFAVSIGLDFVVIGDVLDIGRQGYYFLVSSDEFSIVVLALAASGVLTTLIPTADPFVSAAKSTAKIIGKIAKIDKLVAEPLGKALAHVAKEGNITKLNSLTSLAMKFSKFGELRALRTLIKNSDDVFRLAEYVGKYGDEGLEFVVEMEKEFQRLVPKIDSDGVRHIWIDGQHSSSFWKTKGIDSADELEAYLNRFLSNLNGKPIAVYRYWDRWESVWVDQFGVYDEVKDIVVAINRKDGVIKTAFPPKGGFSHWLLDSSKHSLPFQIR